MVLINRILKRVIYIVGDDSLKRVLKQSLKNNTMLQMRVPREQDLLSVSLYI